MKHLFCVKIWHMTKIGAFKQFTMHQNGLVVRQMFPYPQKLFQGQPTPKKNVISGTKK